MNAKTAKYAGLVLPPCAWALNTQLGQVLPYVDCRGESWLAAAASLACTAVAAAGTVLILLVWQAGRSRTGLFISLIGCLSGAAFAFAILQQAAAAIVISACEH